MNAAIGSIKDIPPLSNCCYIAAPFFNPPQLELVKQIEDTFSSQERWAFSPRLQHGEKPTKIKSKQDANKIFFENYRAIEACSYMVAVVDWLLPEERELRLVNKSKYHITQPGQQSIFFAESPPLNLPDAGTVWEMGVAFTLRKPVVMFTVRPPTDKMNIMLTESCVGIVRGVEGLAAYLRYETLEQWEGQYT